MPVRLPLFVTLTGADDATDIARMADLSARYPVEWGLLFAPVHQGAGRFPSFDFVAKLIERGAIRFSAHLCGGHAREVVARAARRWRACSQETSIAPRSTRPNAACCPTVCVVSPMLWACAARSCNVAAISRPTRGSIGCSTSRAAAARAAFVARGARRRLLRLRRRPQPGQYRGRSAGDRGLRSAGAALLDRHGKRGADGRPLRSRQVRAGADASVRCGMNCQARRPPRRDAIGASGLENRSCAQFAVPVQKAELIPCCRGIDSPVVSPGDRRPVPPADAAGRWDGGRRSTTSRARSSFCSATRRR